MLQRFFLSFLALSLLGAGCSPDPVVDSGENKATGTETEAPSGAISASNKYVLFTVNTQDFIDPQGSADTLNRVIDVHEMYNVPVDIYLNDAIIQAYEESQPALLERLKTSRMVAVSYHVRPPSPYGNNFDWYGLSDLDQSTLYATLMRYETHEVSPTTGQTTEEAGGYGHLKEVMGYAPPIAGMAAAPDVGPTLARVYKDLGATFLIQHSKTLKLGDKKDGLYLRPEDIEVKLFEQTDKESPALIADLFTPYANTTEDVFMNIKVHDNDFLYTDSAWTTIYLYNGTGGPKPPWNLSQAKTRRSPLSQEEKDALWKDYEDAVKFVGQHPELYNKANAFDLMKMLGV